MVAVVNPVESFISAVKGRDSVIFQRLLGDTNYLWGDVYNSDRFTDDDRKWAMDNVPQKEIDSDEFGLNV